MDEDQFRAKCSTLNQWPCPFAKGILTQRCRCEQAQILLLAGRESVQCQMPSAYALCASVTVHLNDKARFALKIVEPHAPLPHAKQMKLVCGSLFCLQRLLYPAHAEAQQVMNIYHLLQAALQHYGELAAFPWIELVRSVGDYQVRRRKPR